MILYCPTKLIRLNFIVLLKYKISPTKSIKVDKVSYPEGEKAVQVVGCIEQKKIYILVYIVVDYMLWCLPKKRKKENFMVCISRTLFD